MRIRREWNIHVNFKATFLASNHQTLTIPNRVKGLIHLPIRVIYIFIFSNINKNP